MDRLNDISYAYHYRDLDSAAVYADSAYLLSANYADGRAEAANHLAFVSIVRMDYDEARKRLDEVVATTDNQIELIVSDVMQMLICQRMSQSREFYDWRERAKKRLQRIAEERASLSARSLSRAAYAEAEYAIVCSEYYENVGMDSASVMSIAAINPDEFIKSDTAQYLNYLYHAGLYGLSLGVSVEDMWQGKFESLFTCYVLASRHGYVFFMASALDAMANILSNPYLRGRMAADNPQMMLLINPDRVDDSLLPGYLSEAALFLFGEFGSAYHVASAYCTLASCYISIGDYQSALSCLNDALSDEKVGMVPELIARIREQLSIAYSGLDDKHSSDYNRNIYLDLQEQTRQDRYLESHAMRLEETAMQLNLMIVAVIAAIVLLAFLLWLFNHLHRRRRHEELDNELLKPMEEWQERNSARIEALRERQEKLREDHDSCMVSIKGNERRNIENRAKVALANSVVPLIDRIIHELDMLSTRSEAGDVREERYKYISELAGKINEYNDVLTHWIQMRHGMLDLHVESFKLMPLFDLVAQSRPEFISRGLDLCVVPTDTVVKADRILTLFMINTLAENARKFTGAGGQVTIRADEAIDYVEISVSDTGCGIPAERLAHIFDLKMCNGHGFGLANCCGIIDKYKKVSQIFRCCTLSAESEEGRGSRFYFRLPKGMKRVFSVLALVSMSVWPDFAHPSSAVGDRQSGFELSVAGAFADSAYFSNINGTYAKTLEFADSCIKYLNAHYLRTNAGGHCRMVRLGDGLSLPPEIMWYRDSILTNYDIILDIRNESAVASLALHDWDSYNYNNGIYTQLFKELSVDSTLADYCKKMHQSQANKTISVIILLCILVMILPAYYVLYYRHVLFFRFCVERVKAINDILLSDLEPSEKLADIEPLSHEAYPGRLAGIVAKIKQSLADTISIEKKQQTGVELMEDELRRAEYENNNLYVANSIIDNCLSVLKHETMYYPGRIGKLVTGRDADLQALHELVGYYRGIYSNLCLQAMRQVLRVRLRIVPVEVRTLIDADAVGLRVIGSPNLLRYMFEILKSQPGYEGTEADVLPTAPDYVAVIVFMRGSTSGNTHNLFAPSVDAIPYLLCRQVVSELSEATGRRRCGMEALHSDGRAAIRIVLPKYH